MTLREKVAIVTGASQGIGEATALKLAEAGGHLMLTARNQEKLSALADKINASGHAQALYTPADTCKPDDVEKVVHNTLANFGQIDILINNAGVAGKIALLQEISLEEIDRIIDTNLKGAIYWIRSVLPAMVAQQGGIIVNMNSIAGKTAYPYWSIYDASKFGLDAITTAVREEQRRNNIKVIGIYPGTVDTPIWETIEMGSEPDRSGMLHADDIANAIVYALQQPNKTLVEEITLAPLNPAL